MNNKGQTLALFVIILPVIVLLLILVYDVGRMTLLKNELDNINYLTINYGLDKVESIDENALIEIIKKNKNNIDNIDVKIINNKIVINLDDNISNSFKLLSDVNIFNVKSSYYGYLNEEGKKIIERDK